MLDYIAPSALQLYPSFVLGIYQSRCKGTKFSPFAKQFCNKMQFFY